MIIHSETIFEWSDELKQYIKVYDRFFEYNGLVALACGATSAQTATANAQSNFYNQLTSQATTVFGSASQVFNGLMSTFAPIVAAGPSQQGFSPAQVANLNSQAITQSGQAYKNEKAAVGNAEAAVGGGKVALPNGANVGTNLSLAENAGNQTANELGQITQANYAQGNKNYESAVAGEENAPSVFGTASGAAGAATSGGEAAANTENQIAQENNSWMSAVSGVLGDVAGVATGNLTKNLGNQSGTSVPDSSSDAGTGNYGF